MTDRAPKLLIPQRRLIKPTGQLYPQRHLLPRDFASIAVLNDFSDNVKTFGPGGIFGHLNAFNNTSHTWEIDGPRMEATNTCLISSGTADPENQAFTVFMWWRRTADRAVWRYWFHCSNFACASMRQDSTTEAAGEVYVGYAATANKLPVDLLDGRWHLVGMTNYGDITATGVPLVNIFFDDYYADSGQIQDASSGADVLCIGGRDDSPNRWGAGQVGIAGYYDRVLTAGEAKMLWQAGFDGYAPRADPISLLLTPPVATAPSYDETFTATSAADLALVDTWALDYAETFLASSAADLALVDTWALDYAETFLASSAADLALVDTWAVDYAEMFLASSAADLALVDTWALDYLETFTATSAAELALTDVYDTPGNYDESFTATSAAELALADTWALDYLETFTATSAAELALADTWALDYLETFTATSAAELALTDAWALNYLETFTASSTAELALTDAYDSPSTDYNETFTASAAADLALTDAYAPNYTENFVATSVADLLLAEGWALDYAETFAASAAADLALTDAYDAPAPGSFDETFAAASLGDLALAHVFTTPNALPAGIYALHAADITPHYQAQTLGDFFTATDANSG